jgi:hypothetical protein
VDENGSKRDDRGDGIYLKISLITDYGLPGPLSPCHLAHVSPKLEPGGGEGIDSASLQGSALIKVEGTR